MSIRGGFSWKCLARLVRIIYFHQPQRNFTSASVANAAMGQCGDRAQTGIATIPNTRFTQPTPCPCSSVRTEPLLPMCLHTPCSSAAFHFSLPCDLKPLSLSPYCDPSEPSFLQKVLGSMVFKWSICRRGSCSYSSF